MTEEENIIKVGSLPDIVPVFPLPGALVFPGASLPLNIFEPRYLSMTNDSLAKGRWIGMVQPRDTMEHPVPDKVGIFEVGSLTRITSYENIDEKRVLVRPAKVYENRRRRVEQAGISDTEEDPDAKYQVQDCHVVAGE